MELKRKTEWVYKKLKEEWNLSDSILKQVGDYFEPSYPDEANYALADAMNYLEGMTGYEYSTPAEYWDDYCEENDINDPNPFE